MPQLRPGAAKYINKNKYDFLKEYIYVYASLNHSFVHLKLTPEEGNGNPVQYSCLESPMHRATWQAAVHGVTKESDKTE